jgi:hypothetical protein
MIWKPRFVRYDNMRKSCGFIISQSIQNSFQNNSPELSLIINQVMRDPSSWELSQFQICYEGSTNCEQNYIEILANTLVDVNKIAPGADKCHPKDPRVVFLIDFRLNIKNRHHWNDKSIIPFMKVSKFVFQELNRVLCELWCIWISSRIEIER